MIWLVGNKGMLGREIQALLNEEQLEFVGTDREVSILDPKAIEEFAAEKSIKWVINCAAYTAVDKAEEEEDKARILNAEGPENLAKFCSSIGAKLIHISTDYVFDGSKDEPLNETEPTAPIGIYGKTKLLGENEIKQALDSHYILRTAWLYGNAGPSFVHTMINLMKTKPELKVVSDQFGSPTYTYDLAKAIIQIISLDNNQYGIYHFSNQGRTNWFEFAKQIQKEAKDCGLLEKTCPIYPVDSSAYPTKAKRPSFSLLDKSKIIKNMNMNIPAWEESLKKFLTEDFSKWNEN